MSSVPFEVSLISTVLHESGVDHRFFVEADRLVKVYHNPEGGRLLDFKWRCEREPEDPTLAPALEDPTPH